MLFNSYAFLFVFMPICVIGFAVLVRVSHQLALVWLTAASFAFYAYWGLGFLPILAVSILMNFGFGKLIASSVRPRATRILIAAVSANLLALGYFKYTIFLVESVNQFFGTKILLSQIELPLGISFFTFTQIAYLVDVYRRVTYDDNLVRYSLFVSYFPHLIAGPILHHRPVISQFAQPDVVRLRAINWAIGLTLFQIGLAKKLLLADNLGVVANPIFDAARDGTTPSLIAGWIGALAYTFQLYYDFSGYSDMAVGLSLLFGVAIPINFASPYKAASIIEFWRRWHISLSTFLRDYLYIPLGGNRHGAPRRYWNLMVTMVLGGLWHGANWTFVLWGLLHGVYLLVNHAWRALIASIRGPSQRHSVIGGIAGGAITFVTVVIGWVLFRADNVTAAGRMLRGMSAFNLELLAGPMAAFRADPLLATQPAYLLPLLGVAAVIAFAAPNSNEIAAAVKRMLEAEHRRGWALSAAAVLCGLCFGVALLFLGRVTHFLYFQF